MHARRQATMYYGIYMKKKSVSPTQIEKLSIFVDCTATVVLLLPFKNGFHFNCSFDSTWLVVRTAKFFFFHFFLIECSGDNKKWLKNAISNFVLLCLCTNYSIYNSLVRENSWFLWKTSVNLFDIWYNLCCLFGVFRSSTLQWVSESSTTGYDIMKNIKLFANSPLISCELGTEQSILVHIR